MPICTRCSFATPRRADAGGCHAYVGGMTQDRSIIAVTGADRDEFLQGLVTNDIARAKDGLAYAALLTP